MSDKKLPPDPDGQNDKRAEWAGTAIVALGQETGADWEAPGASEAFRDLLCDLRHWADRNGVDIESEWKRARKMYADETFDEEK